MKTKSGLTLIEFVIMVAIAALLILEIDGCIHHERVEMPEAYRVWCKQTGNPKDLTYREWRSLINATTPLPRNDPL